MVGYRFNIKQEYKKVHNIIILITTHCETQHPLLMQ
jgi:hypothetical protein